MKELSLSLMLGVMKTQSKGSPKLFRRYLEALSKAPPDDQLYLIFDLLTGIQSVFEYNIHQKAIMREIEGFTHLLQPLTWETQTQDKLCVTVLKTLGATLSGNPENKEHFNHTIGYDQLQEVILHSTNRNPTIRVVEVLFDLMLDGVGADFFTSDETIEKNSPTIRNPHIATVLLTLLPYFDPTSQDALLSRFIKLIEKSTENQSSCSSVYLMYDLLKSLSLVDQTKVPKLITLIEILGTHSITVRELKRLFKLLKGDSDDTRVHTSYLT